MHAPILPLLHGLFVVDGSGMVVLLFVLALVVMVPALAVVSLLARIYEDGGARTLRHPVALAATAAVAVLLLLWSEVAGPLAVALAAGVHAAESLVFPMVRPFAAAEKAERRYGPAYGEPLALEGRILAAGLFAVVTVVAAVAALWLRGVLGLD